MINDSKLLIITDQKHYFLKAMATVTSQSTVGLIFTFHVPSNENTPTPKS